MASGFVTETELAEARRVRQEEWEKVRTAEQPLDAPEEEYDSRSLYERLQEQKHKKDHDFDEAHKLKNMIKTLDDDEVEFLDLVDKNRMQAERQAHIEEQKELNEFRAKVATLQEKRLDEQIQQQVSKPKPTKTPIVGTRMSQKQILAGVVVRKRKLEPDNEHKEPTEQLAPAKLAKVGSPKEASVPTTNASNNQPKPTKSVAAIKPAKPVDMRMRVIGILPGMGSYDDDDESDSDNSSADSEVDTCQGYDFIGRKIRRTCDDK